jgi:hypothetical protein
MQFRFTEEQKERLRLWVSALRSGEYKQGSNRLRLEDPDTGEITWCCLGVACDIAQKNGAPVQLAGNPLVYQHPFVEKEFLVDGYVTAEEILPDGTLLHSSSHTYMPRAVLEWYGIPEGSWQGDPVVHGDHLASWNDRGIDFETIARWIEEEYGLTEEPANA